MTSQPNPWTHTVIKPRASNDVRYLFRSPEGKLIFDQQLVGKLFNIVSDRLDVDGANLPDPSALEEARKFVQVQFGDNLYVVSYLRSDGTPQVPTDFQTFWHALQKPNGDWCFVPKSQTSIPEDWPPAGLFNPPQPPAAEPEESEEPEKPKEAKPVEKTNIPNPNSRDGARTEVRRSGNDNHPITNLSRFAGVSEAGARRRNPERSEGSLLPNYHILTDLEALISNHLVCSDAQRTVLALWILHTYAYDATPVTPYLNIYSPMEESGKSACMTILRGLCADPWWAAGSSPSFFKRKLISEKTTILLDNWHTLLRASDRHQMSGFLLNGCDMVPDLCARAERAQNHSLEHCRYSPKAFAGMESLPPALARRSIPIVLQRRKPNEKVKSAMWLMFPPLTEKLIASMKVWAKDHTNAIAEAHVRYETETIPGLAPHQQENVKVLIALAAAIGGDWLLKAYEALREVFDDYNEGQVSPTQLLSDIRDAFARRGNQERIFTAELLDYLHDLDERTWYEYGKSGKPMTPQALSVLLRKHFGIYSRSQRRGQQKLRGYQLSDFIEAWERHLPAQEPEDITPSEPSSEDSEPIETDAQSSPVSPNKNAPCLNVSVRKSKPNAPARANSRTGPKSTSTEKARIKTTSRLKNFAAKTMRLFTAIWS